MHPVLIRGCALGVAMLAAPLAVAGPVSWNTLSGAAPVVIGHRGAPAYLPENSLGGNELAARMGAQLIETDVLLTRDNDVVVMHDLTLDRTTNVADLFLPRNGGYAVADFDLAEIQSLTIKPTGTGATTYPGFMPSMADPYRVPSLAEMLDEINAYNTANGTDVGILTELKGPSSALASQLVVQAMIDKGFTTDAKNGYVQSFDFANVFAMATEIDAAGVDMDVFQLGGAAFIGGQWFVALSETNARPLNLLASYVDGIAIFEPFLTQGLIDAAHSLDLEVYGWTFRPLDLADAQAQIAPFLDWGLDGYITDNPDLIGTAIGIHGTTPVPLPAALPLLLAALGGLRVLRRNRRAA